MATLTAAGVSFADGNINGQYTGTDGNNSSWPVGSYLGVAGAQPNRNSQYTVYTHPSTTISYQINSGAVAMAGTWAARGMTMSSSSGYYTLFQRVS